MGHNSVANLRKTIFYNTKVELVNDDEHTKFGLIMSISSREKQILTSIKGRNSVATLRKTKIYKTNVDHVNDNVYTKFGLNLLFVLKILSKNQNSDVNLGP